MTAAALVLGVDPSDARDWVAVEADELERKLGRAAWHTWQVLIHDRRRDGFTCLGVDGIAAHPRFVAVHRLAVKDALRRLELASLVERVGWGRKAGSLTKTYWRRVFGALMLDVRPGSTAFAAVPRDTRAWMARATTWGGSRSGAGRKNPGIAIVDRCETVSSTSNLRVVGGNQVPPLTKENTYMISKPNNVDGTSPSEKFAAADGGVVSQIQVPGIGTVFGGRAPVRRIYGYAETIPGAPPFPGPSIIQVAKVPPAPKLVSTDPLEVRIRLAVLAFRAAVESVYGGRCFLYAKGLSRDAREYPAVAQSVEYLTAYEIAPIAWCLFAVRRWMNIKDHEEGAVKMGRKGAKPPLRAIFNPASIVKRCADPDDRYVVRDCALGGRLVYGDKHRKLGKLYDRMLRLINREDVPPEEAAAQVFPSGLYDELLDLAKAEAAEIQYRLERSVAEGKDVWSLPPRKTKKTGGGRRRKKARA